MQRFFFSFHYVVNYPSQSIYILRTTVYVCRFGIQVMPSIQAPNRTTFKSWISLFRKYEGRLYVAEKSKWVCHVIVSKSSHIKRHLLTTLFMVYLWQLF